MSVGTTQAGFRSRSLGQNPGLTFLRDWGGILVAVPTIGLPVMLHTVSPALAILVCGVLAVLVANFATRLVPAVLIFSYVFQNAFVAFVSPLIQTPEELDAIRAYNFLITAVVWVILYLGYWIDRKTLDPSLRRLIDLTTVALALIGFYFLLGATSDLVPSVIYLRNVATPFLLIHVFALVAYRQPVEFVRPLFVISLLAVVFGYLELFFHEGFYKLINGDAFFKLGFQRSVEAGEFLRQMNETGYVVRSYLDKIQVDLFNTPLLADWNITVSRLGGPNFHPISYAYFLVGSTLVLMAAGRWLVPVLALPLILIVGSKGAFVLLLFGAAGLFLTYSLPVFRQYWFYILLLVLYAIIGVIIGIRISDFHVIGFIGGIRGFLGNPLGHGLGAGGNLSVSEVPTDWTMAQQTGHTDVGMESAIGVLLYQVGVATFVLIALSIPTSV